MSTYNSEQINPHLTSDTIYNLINHISREHPAVARVLLALIISGSGFFAAPTETKAQESRPAIEMNTVPEQEPGEPFMGFKSIVETFDANGNPKPGVVVATAHSTTGNVSLSDPNVDLSQWAVGIAPLGADATVTTKQQFPTPLEQGIIIGGIAEDYWQSIIDKAIAEGDTSTAEYLQTHFSATQPLENAVVTLYNARSGEGENPSRVQFELRNSDGRPTAIVTYEYPSYRLQGNDDSATIPMELGEKVGFLQPITNTQGVNTDPISVSFTSGITQELKVSIGSEDIAVSAPVTSTEPITTPLSAAAIVTDTPPAADLDTLVISAIDQRMLDREKEFQLFLQSGEDENEDGSEVSGAHTQEPGEKDHRLAVAIHGTAQVDSQQSFTVLFTKENGQQVPVVLTDILPTDEFVLKIINGEVVVENLSGTPHAPTIVSPQKPTEIEPSGNTLYVPSVSN